MTPLLYLMACLMSPSPPLDLAESRVKPKTQESNKSVSPRGGLQRTWSMHGKGSIIEDLVWGYPREGD